MGLGTFWPSKKVYSNGLREGREGGREGGEARPWSALWEDLGRERSRTVACPPLHPSLPPPSLPPYLPLFLLPDQIHQGRGPQSVEHALHGAGGVGKCPQWPGEGVVDLVEGQRAPGLKEAEDLGERGDEGGREGGAGVLTSEV
jgi:hypothetical protein